MKISFKQHLAYSIIFLLLPTIVLAESIKVTDENAPFLYESRAEIKMSDDKLAGFLSSDYRNARDEFTKHDLFERIAPVIKKRLEEGKNTIEIVLRIGANLGDYNFDKNAFATGIGETTFVPFNNGYAVTFTNAMQIALLPVPMESARSLSSSLSKNRRANLTIYGEIVGAKEQKLNWNTKKSIQVKISRLEITLKSGKKVGVKKL